jgi:hypothetical protein
MIPLVNDPNVVQQRGITVRTWGHSRCTTLDGCQFTDENAMKILYEVFDPASGYLHQCFF